MNLAVKMCKSCKRTSISTEDSVWSAWTFSNVSVLKRQHRIITFVKIGRCDVCFNGLRQKPHARNAPRQGKCRL